jgi:hypothetical protein
MWNMCVRKDIICSICFFQHTAHTFPCTLATVSPLFSWGQKLSGICYLLW